MSDVDLILSEFMRAWQAGETPDPDDYLERVDPADQHELSQQIRAYLMVAPEPSYDEATWQRLCDDPAAIRAAAIPLGEPEPWPSLLPRLRERAGLTWDEVARRLGVGRPERAAGYLTAMERGEHDPLRVTRRALEKLARILNVPADALAWTGGTGPVALLRASGGAAAAAPAAAPASKVEIIADMAMSEAVDWDDSDDLFLGGRDLV